MVGRPSADALSSLLKSSNTPLLLKESLQLEEAEEKLLHYYRAKLLDLFRGTFFKNQAHFARENLMQPLSLLKHLTPPGCLYPEAGNRKQGVVAVMRTWLGVGARQDNAKKPKTTRGGKK